VNSTFTEEKLAENYYENFLRLVSALSSFRLFFLLYRGLFPHRFFCKSASNQQERNESSP